MSIGNHMNCPVCEGFKTTSGNPSIRNHIIGYAKTELYRRELLDKNYPTPHLDYIKENYTLIDKCEKIIKF